MSTVVLGTQYKSGQNTNNNGSQSGTGGMAESTRYTGTPATSKKFDLASPGSEANPHIGNNGFGN